MKAIIQLFRKSIGWPLGLWMVLFLVWRVLYSYYTVQPIKNVEDLKVILVSLDLASYVLRVWFLGYFFWIAVRASRGAQTPLYPLALKDSLVMGVHIFCRLFFVCLPLIFVYWATLMLNNSDAENFFYGFSLLYIILLVIPFCVYFVAEAERLPYHLGWNFFKKKLDLCLIFLFLGSFSYYVWNIFARWLYGFIENVTVLSWKEVSLFLLGYASLFYLMSFNAVLLGLIAKKTKTVPKDAVVKEQKVEENKTVEKKAVVKEQKVKENKKVEKAEVKKTRVKKASAVKKTKKTVKKSKTSKK